MPDQYCPPHSFIFPNEPLVIFVYFPLLNDSPRFGLMNFETSSVQNHINQIHSSTYFSELILEEFMSSDINNASEQLYFSPFFNDNL